MQLSTWIIKERKMIQRREKKKKKRVVQKRFNVYLFYYYFLFYFLVGGPFGKTAVDPVILFLGVGIFTGGFGVGL